VDKTYMNVKELAGYLGVSKDTVYDLVKERAVPFTYIGRLPRFHKPTIDKWMEKRLVPAA
jgi:excisionase family DNA binding protein